CSPHDAVHGPSRRPSRGLREWPRRRTGAACPRGGRRAREPAGGSALRRCAAGAAGQGTARCRGGTAAFAPARPKRVGRRPVLRRYPERALICLRPTEHVLKRIDLRGRPTADSAELRAELPRAVLDVSAAVAAVEPIVEDVRERGLVAVR